MPGKISISLPDTIESITILDGCPAPAEADINPGRHGNDFPSNVQEKKLAQACEALREAAAGVQQLYERVVAQRSEEIAKLAIEIARKILMQKIETEEFAFSPGCSHSFEPGRFR